MGFDTAKFHFFCQLVNFGGYCFVLLLWQIITLSEEVICYIKEDIFVESAREPVTRFRLMI